MKIYQISRLQDYEYKYAIFSTLKAAKDFVKKSVGFVYDKDKWTKNNGYLVYDEDTTFFIKPYEVDKEAFE